MRFALIATICTFLALAGCAKKPVGPVAEPMLIRVTREAAEKSAENKKSAAMSNHSTAKEEKPYNYVAPPPDNSVKWACDSKDIDCYDLGRANIMHNSTSAGGVRWTLSSSKL